MRYTDYVIRKKNTLGHFWNFVLMLDAQVICQVHIAKPTIQNL